jgi:parallel beta-helix repeat protein
VEAGSSGDATSASDGSLDGPATEGIETSTAGDSSGATDAVADVTAPDGSGFDASNDATSDAVAATDASDVTSDALVTTDASDASSADGGAGDGAPSDGAAHDGAAADGDASPCAVTAVYVDAIDGETSGSGTSSSPYKSIARAIVAATTNACITTIRVNPGTYDVANGETFPIVVPPGVALVGDEAAKGIRTSGAVFIDGSGYTTGQLWVAVTPQSGSTVAGFEITAPFPTDAASASPAGVQLPAGISNVTIRNCTLTGNEEAGIFINGGTNIEVTGNVATNNGLGLYVGDNGTAKFEANSVTSNIYGVELDTGGGDLGGGALASAGGNTLSCNTSFDLWTTASGVFAENDAWDHVSPTVSPDGGTADIFTTGTTPNTMGATLAVSPCP